MVLSSMEALRISPPKGDDIEDDSSEDEEQANKALLPIIAPQYSGGEVTFIFHVGRNQTDVH